VNRNLRLAIFVLAALLIGSSALSRHLTLRSFASQTTVALVQGPRAYSQDVDKFLKRYDKLELDPATSAEHVQQSGRFFLPTSEGGFEMTLRARDLRSERYRAQESLDGGVVRELERGPVRTYKGSIDGMPGGQARLTIDKETFEGMIITPGQIFFVEPAKRYSASAGSLPPTQLQNSDASLQVTAVTG